jgi:hypothetical protein
MLATRNENWGFYGAITRKVDTEFANYLWEDVLEMFRDMLNWPETMVRDFLDSSYGRDLADSLNFDELACRSHIPAWLKREAKSFAKTYNPADFAS